MANIVYLVISPRVKTKTLVSPMLNVKGMPGRTQVIIKYLMHTTHGMLNTLPVASLRSLVLEKGMKQETRKKTGLWHL